MPNRSFTELSVNTLRSTGTDVPVDIDSISLRSFLDDLKMGAYIVDQDRKITYWNDAAREITGFTAEQVVGTRCLDEVLCHTDYSGVSLCSTHLCPLYRSMKTGESSNHPFSVFAQGKDGKKIPLNITTIPLKRGDRVTGGLEIFEKVRFSSSDLERAMQIQKSLIPQNPPENVELFYLPSSLIGGDLIHASGDWVALADVSGHGISSALVSTALRVMFMELLTTDLDIRQLGDLLEKHYGSIGELNLFFTGIFLKMVPDGVEIACFGHPAPILIRKNGRIRNEGEAIENGSEMESISVETIEVDHDVLIGWKKPHTNHYQFIPLADNESIILYSDGIIELEKPNGPLGESGLKDILKTSDSLKDVYIEAMTREELSGQRDDISMVRVRRRKG